MRLNKYLSDAGVCSRREADRLVEEGKILVDGVQATLGMQVTGDSGKRKKSRAGREKNTSCFS